MRIATVYEMRVNCTQMTTKFTINFILQRKIVLPLEPQSASDSVNGGLSITFVVYKYL